MNDNKKHLEFLTEQLIKAKQGDEQAIKHIIVHFKSFCEAAAAKYLKNIEYHDYDDLVQEGLIEVTKTINDFNFEEYDFNNSYFKIRISRRIRRYYYKNFDRKFDGIDTLSDDLTEDKLVENILEKAMGPLLSKDERYVFINSNRGLGKSYMSQNELAADLNVSQPTISRISRKALDKILISLHMQRDKTRIRQIINKDIIKLSFDEKVKYLEDVFQLLNDMLPVHMPMLKIEKKINDNEYRGQVIQGIPVTVNHQRNTVTVDTDTPQRELNALVQFLLRFIDPNKSFNETFIINKIPARNILIDFVRLYAPYTTKGKMNKFLKKINVAPGTRRGYLSDNPNIRFNRKKTELYLTIFDNYIERTGTPYISFNYINNALRIITLEELITLDNKGLIKPPYYLDKKKEIFYRKW